MPYQPQKNERYDNFGGINRKSSLYFTQEQEQLRLFNLDFTSPGALTTPWGYTQQLAVGNTTRFSSIYEYTQLSQTRQRIAAAGDGLFNATGSGVPSRIFTSGASNNPWSFVTFVDRLFGADGSQFVSYNGTSAYSLVRTIPPYPSYAAVAGGSLAIGSYRYTYGYISEEGSLTATSEAGTGIPPGTVVLLSPQSIAVSGFTFPSMQGLSAIALYRNGFFLATLAPTAATFLDTGFTLSVTPQPLFGFTQAPRFLSLYNNSLFAIGFSSNPSTVFYSEVGIPTDFGATFSLEVRTNDGDVLTGGVPFSSRLVLSKTRSMHAVEGDEPPYGSQQLTSTYGSLSHRTMRVIDDYLLFLDAEGICRYNGANFEIISTPVEDTFQRMNIPAAIDRAAMMHIKDRNEVWTVFPIDGATFNNRLVVYDYTVNRFYESENVAIASFDMLQGSLARPYPQATDYSGQIFQYGPTFFTNNGAPIQFGYLSKYFQGELGYSTTKQFRQLYFDVDPTAGVGATLNVSLYTNVSPTPSRSFPVGTTSFQTRINFGIPAKTMAVGFSGQAGATCPFRLNGLTVQSRFQRAT